MLGSSSPPRTDCRRDGLVHRAFAFPLSLSPPSSQIAGPQDIHAKTKVVRAPARKQAPGNGKLAPLIAGAHKFILPTLSMPPHHTTCHRCHRAPSSSPSSEHGRTPRPERSPREQRSLDRRAQHAGAGSAFVRVRQGAPARRWSARAEGRERSGDADAEGGEQDWRERRWRERRAHAAAPPGQRGQEAQSVVVRHSLHCAPPPTLAQPACKRQLVKSLSFQLCCSCPAFAAPSLQPYRNSSSCSSSTAFLRPISGGLASQSPPGSSGLSPRLSPGLVQRNRINKGTGEQQPARVRTE